MNGLRVHDRVHGEVTLPPLAAALVATPIFHRLDGIRQLGGCAFVYPSATHTRREHAIGVCHLAGRLVRHLQRLHPELVDDDDVLCAELAGLVHDLGHGPFSHLFEDHVRATLDPRWSHETMGLRLLDALLADAPPTVRLTAAQRRFVGLLVTGLEPGAPWPADAGRDASKRFLVDVVHNRGSGIDVDKLDYLARDALAVFGATRPLALDRLVAAARVVDGVLAYDEKVAPEMAEVYALRARLHRHVYQHRAVAVVEHLLMALLASLDDLTLETLHDPRAFARLTDAWALWFASPAAPRAVAARAALHRRPWLTRLPVAAHLRTRPVCARCGASTEVHHAFCAQCGASTVDRPAAVVASSSPPVLLVPPECALTAAEATREVCRRAGRDDLVVHLADVHCGVPTTVVDPHDRAWRDYDHPLAHLTFYCARDGRAVRLPPSAFGACAPRHERVAHAYLPPDASEAEVCAASLAFSEWAGEVGEASSSWPTR
jgi:HD superfamily phosphohydrolase